MLAMGAPLLSGTRKAVLLVAGTVLAGAACLNGPERWQPDRDAGAVADAGEIDANAARPVDVGLHDGPPVAADPVACDSSFPFPFTAGGPVYDVLPRTRELDTRSVDPEGEVTLHFTDGFYFVYRFDQDAPPLMPDLGPVDFLEYAGQCWDQGCSTLFHALEAPGVGRFLEYGLLNAVDGDDLEHWVCGSLFLRIRYGRSEDVCPSGGGEVPAVLQAVSDDGVLDLLPGQQLDANVGASPWRVRSGPARRLEYVEQSGCNGCAPYVVHTDTVVYALAYRRAP